MELLFRKIVLAYDGSEGSGKALKLASELMKSHQESHLTVVNVYDEKIETRRVDLPGEIPSDLQGYMMEGMSVPPVPLGYSRTVVSTQSIITNSVEQIFYDARKELANLNADFQVLEGNPAESICTFAEDAETDLIIVGSSGKSGIKGMLVGNVTEKISRMAPCHVLIAK